MTRLNGLWGAAATLALAVLLAQSAHAERIALSVPLTDRGFEKIAHRKGVTVYKHKESDVIKLAADARLNATPAEVLRAVTDYERQVGVMDRLSEVKVLSRRGKRLTVYQRLNLPVISDRDFNLKVVWWKDGDTTWVAYRALPKSKGVHPKDGVVRVTRHSGSWQLKPINGGRGTLARFQVTIDLSGWLPKWMAKSGSGKEVPELFTSINTMIRKARYRSATCTSNCL